MNGTFEILVVEDDNEMYEAYNDSVEEFNEGGGVKFILTRERTSAGARKSLLSNKFDGAIVDLNLDTNKPSEASGNEVLKEITESHRFPVFIVSGNLGNLDHEIREKESNFLKCFSREKPNKEILEEIKNICQTGITHILGGRGQIEEKLGEIFWKHFANDLDYWFEKREGTSKALLRYTLSHLYEYLDVPNSSNDCYHEAEFYIKPPIREYIASGDIVESKGDRYIVLSPACDVAVRELDGNNKPIINANRIALAKLIRFQRDEFLKNNIIKADDNGKQREKIIAEIINGQNNKHAYIPEYKGLYASVVDLQNMYSIDFSEFQNDYKRLATVSSSFLKDIQSRFSSYYGRQGQPDLNKKELVRKNKRLLSPS